MVWVHSSTQSEGLLIVNPKIVLTDQLDPLMKFLIPTAVVAQTNNTLIYKHAEYKKEKKNLIYMIWPL